MRHGELPDGLVLRRTTPDFDERTVPAGLTREHRIATGVWGLLRVAAGRVVFVEESPDAAASTTLHPGDEMVIRPDQPHHVEPGTGCSFHVEFWAPPAADESAEESAESPQVTSTAAVPPDVRVADPPEGAGSDRGADIARNLAAVRDAVAAAARGAGRDPAEIRLLPVSKTVHGDVMRLAVAAGCREFGENKVQEARRKAEELADLDLRWAVIGHLQTNKAKDVVAFAHEFHALDSIRVAEALDRRLQSAGRSLDVYVQVNTSEEESKYGLAPAELIEFLAQIPRLETLRVKGLMTLALNSTEEARVRSCFRGLRELRDRAMGEGLLAEGGLSMGMSGDYRIAIEEGSTVLRIGQAIFGARPLPDSHYWPAGTTGPTAR